MSSYAKLALKALMITALLFFCAFGYLLAGLLYMSNALGKDQFYMASVSPDGRWSLTIEDGGAFIYSPTVLHVYANEYSPSASFVKRKVLDFQVSNDGKSLNEYNCKISWENPTVPAISCVGEEQPEAVYRVDLLAEFSKKTK